jgi:hypothetical protein
VDQTPESITKDREGGDTEVIVGDSYSAVNQDSGFKERGVNNFPISNR